MTSLLGITIVRPEMHTHHQGAVDVVTVGVDVELVDDIHLAVGLETRGQG